MCVCVCVCVCIHIFIYNMYVCIIQGVLTGTLARGQDYAGAPDGNSPAATLRVPHLYDVNVKDPQSISISVSVSIHLYLSIYVQI